MTDIAAMRQLLAVAAVRRRARQAFQSAGRRHALEMIRRAEKLEQAEGAR
jgi:hypothetical protein